MKNSKKLIGAVAAVVVALVISVGSTFAWFTTNNKVTVEGIKATVTTGDSNLEVAFVYADNTVGAFGYALDFDKDETMKKVIANVVFDALTDNGELDKTSSPNSWKGTEKKNGLALRNKKGENGVAAKVDETGDNKVPGNGKGNYLKFTLRFRTPSSDKTKDGLKLKLSTDSSVTSTHSQKENGYTPLVATDGSLDTDFGIAKDRKIETNAQDAIRVAFHQVNATSHEVEDKTGAAGWVWTPHADSESYKGKNLAQAVEAMLTEGKTVTDFDGLYTDPAYNDIAAAKRDTSSSSGADDRMVVVTLKDDATTGYCTADVQIIIWLEGTDADCLNSIFSDDVVIKLAFETPSED